MLPDGWAIKTLESLASVQRGKFTPRPRNDPRYYGGHMPFVQTGDVTSAGKYLTEFNQTLNDEGVGVSKVFPPDSILITIAANIGFTAITTFDVACPDSLVGIQPIKGRCDVQWLKDVLETRRDELDSLATQNAQKNINLEVLRPLRISTPPLAEQRKIAEILSTWDAAISAQERLIGNAKRQKEALMQTLLPTNGRPPKKRLPGFSGDWKCSTLEDVAQVIVSNVDKKSGEGEQPVRLCNYMDVYRADRIEADMPFMRATAAAAQIRKFGLRVGDVLITKDSETPDDIAVPSYVASTAPTLFVAITSPSSARSQKPMASF